MSADPARRLAPVVRLAPAKLNLTLAVVGRRPDGYHALHSVFVPLAVADRLSLAPAAGSEDTLRVEGHDAGPVADNLVLRALAAAREAVGRGWVGAAQGWAAPAPAPGAPALAARLEKRIPVAAGLAGGSSDAAAAILGALEAWGAALDPDALLRLGAGIGSDVPFFLAADPPAVALVQGRGERVEPLPAPDGEVGVLLVTPALPVATPAVFAAYAAGVRPASPAARTASEHLQAELRSGLSAARLLDRASVIASANDLLPATLSLVPALLPFRRALIRLLGRPVAQSGSGPTCFVLYPSLHDAVEAAAAVTAASASGTLPSAGDGPPTVLATTIGAQG